eukprot:7881663-Pyramimonas_sp.AAC.1
MPPTSEEDAITSPISAQVFGGGRRRDRPRQAGFFRRGGPPPEIMTRCGGAWFFFLSRARPCRKPPGSAWLEGLGSALGENAML